MPIFKCSGKSVYYCHIPKCGGTSVEDTIASLGYNMTFIDQGFWSNRSKCWYRSSPQHILAKDLSVLFEKNFFDYSFAVIRDPVARFLSAFNHQRKRIGWFVSLDRFIDKLEVRIENHGDFFSYKYDNHFEPAVNFIIPGATIFKLEDGLEKMFLKLSSDLGIPQPNEVFRNNVNSYRLQDQPGTLNRLIPSSPGVSNLSFEQKSRIEKIYFDDVDLYRSL